MNTPTNPQRDQVLYQAAKNTTRPPRNRDAEQYRRQKELELLQRLYGHKGGEA